MISSVAFIYFVTVSVAFFRSFAQALAPNADTFFYSFSDLNPYDPINEGFLAYLYYVGNQTNPPLVHSISYGDTEANIFNASNPGSIEYGTSCDQQFMKLGLRGVTVLISSGDDGIGSKCAVVLCFVPGSFGVLVDLCAVRSCTLAYESFR